MWLMHKTSGVARRTLAYTNSMLNSKLSRTLIGLSVLAMISTGPATPLTVQAAQTTENARPVTAAHQRLSTPASTFNLTVDANANRHAISPYIYGLNFADEALAAELDLPVNRWGGNSTSRYNYLNDTYNTANDWYFQNIPNPNNNVAALPVGSASDKFVEQNQSTGTESFIAIPMIGWAAKRRPPNDSHPYDCGFSIAKYGAQQGNDWQWDPDCGNGRHPNGTPITGNNPLDTSVAVTPTFMLNWVNHLKTQFGSAANGGVQFYNLDNEPDLWHETHRDVFPLALTYDQYRDRTIAYAAAIRAADPTAQILGPASFGWTGYWFSPRDMQNQDWASPDDQNAHGGVPFIPWYLGQMKTYEQNNGLRLIDYLDLHYYPQSGVALVEAGDSNQQALRLRSTRSLWDAAYVDESWIASAGPDGGIVKLIPRMKAWVSANYPGTKLAIGEYNWGGLEHINGALTQADVLGIFGREGVDLATMWAPPASNQPGAFAFRIFRNYDGNGSKFGETSVSAASTDQSQLAIYAAQRTSDLALTLVIINKTGNVHTGNVALANFTPAFSAQVFRYSAANLNAIVQQGNQAVCSNSFSASFPANSITLVVIPEGTVPNKCVWLPLVRK